MVVELGVVTGLFGSFVRAFVVTGDLSSVVTVGDCVVVILLSPDAHDARASDSVIAAKVHRNADNLFSWSFAFLLFFLKLSFQNG